MTDYSYSFPESDFTVTGDAQALRAAAAKYANFGKSAGDTSTSITNLDMGLWTGDEGETVRGMLRVYPAPLNNVSSAFGDVASALTTFASTLETEQKKMNTERAAAKPAWQALQSAMAARSSHANKAYQKIGMNDEERKAWNDEHSRLISAQGSAESTWHGHVTNAEAIIGRVQEASAAAKRKVDAAAQKSPTANQNWFDKNAERLGNWIDEKGAAIRKFIKDHAGWFRGLAIVLKVVGVVMVVVGVVVGVAAVIGVPFTLGGSALGLPVALQLIGWGATVYGAGETVDTITDWGEGKISGKDLVYQGTLDLAITVGTLGVGRLAGPLLKKGLKKLADKAESNPALKSWLEKLMGGKAGGDPHAPKVDMDNLPGKNKDIAAATKDAPVKYTYRNPALDQAGAAAPTQVETALARQGKYEPGTREHMVQRWEQYLNKHKDQGTQPLSWERWRDTYINNMGNQPKGDAFDQQFQKRFGFDADPNWTGGVDARLDVPGQPGKVRDFDVVNQSAKTAYELKSGNSIDPGQLAKDIAFKKAGWDVRYVFGSQPSQATIRKLEDAGIPWDVMHSEATAVK